MVEDHVEHDVNAAFSGLIAEALEIGHAAVGGVNSAVISDIVAVVALRRRVDGVEPEVVHAESVQVVEFADDAGQVADAVAVRVAVGFGIDLVNDFVFEVHGILHVMVAA